MAQDTTLNAFWQTLSAEFSDPQKVFVGTTNLSKSVYHDYKPVVETIGQTINVALPASVTSSVVDGQGADPTLNTPSFSYVPIAFDQNPQWAVVIRDFAQFNSPQLVRNLIVDPAIKGIKEYVNNYLWTKVNRSSGNFNFYAAPTATTASDVTPTQFLGYLESLAESKVPVNDTARMSFLCHPKVYYGILADGANWTNYQIAGQLISEEAKVEGRISTAFGVDIKMDQAATSTGTAPTRTFTNLMMHEYAYALATRPLPAPDGNVVKFSNLMVDDIPLQIMVGYSILSKGYVVIVSCGFGASVIRPLAGLVSTTTEAA